MTTFGWDASHYDAPPTQRDGIDFYTHKLTDGNRWYEDAEFKQALENARDLAIPVLGAYHVLWGNASIEGQAQWFIERLDALTPWWRTLPAGRFILQADAEPFSYNKAPTITQINQWLDLVTAARGIKLEGQSYSATWYYSSSVTGLRYSLWQANYGSNPVGHYRSVYPGDTSSRWNTPKPAMLLQYGSNTTIGNQTTCDANAFRGDIQELIAALGGTSDDGTEVTTMRYSFDDSWPDRPAQLGKRIINTDRLGVYDVEPFGALQTGLPPVVTLSRSMFPLANGPDGFMTFGQVFAQITGDAAFDPAMHGVAGWRQLSVSGGGNGGVTADEVAEIVRDEINNTRLQVEPPDA